MANGKQGVMYDDVVLGGRHHRYLAGKDNLVAELKSTFTSPDDHSKIDAFVKHIEE
jgi:hypothetical protein